MEIERDEAWQDAINVLAKFVDQQRASAPKIREILESELTADTIQELADAIKEPASELRERAEALEEKADLLDEVGDLFGALAEAVTAGLDLVVELEEAEGRDEKQDAREALLEGVGEIVTRHGETLDHDLDEVMDGVEAGFANKLVRVTWRDGSPNFMDENGYDIPYPEEDTVWL